jgi:hypothetical protein
MKTIFFFTILILFLNITVVSASEPITSGKPENKKSGVTAGPHAEMAGNSTKTLIPAIKSEGINTVSEITPEVPKEAGFEDENTEGSFCIDEAILKSLAPVTPDEADFSDN